MSIFAFIFHQVYYRTGIDSYRFLQTLDDTFLKGTGWVEQVGEFTLISVGPNDQVRFLLINTRIVCAYDGFSCP